MTLCHRRKRTKNKPAWVFAIISQAQLHKDTVVYISYYIRIYYSSTSLQQHTTLNFLQKKTKKKNTSFWLDFFHVQIEIRNGKLPNDRRIDLPTVQTSLVFSQSLPPSSFHSIPLQRVVMLVASSLHLPTYGCLLSLSVPPYMQASKLMR